eukprot:m.42033 g.42033  ORF g.42033 m.42033 type:complete len:115 (-) comp10482_c0_seq3:98-442(-)
MKTLLPFSQTVLVLGHLMQEALASLVTLALLVRLNLSNPFLFVQTSIAVFIIQILIQMDSHSNPTNTILIACVGLGMSLISCISSFLVIRTMPKKETHEKLDAIDAQRTLVQKS